MPASLLVLLVSAGLIGRRIHTAFVTLRTAPTAAVRTISRPGVFTVTR